MKRPDRSSHKLILATMIAAVAGFVSAQTEEPNLNPFRSGAGATADPIEQIPQLFDTDTQPEYAVTIPFDRPKLPWPMPLPASQLGLPEPFLPAYLRANGNVERRLMQADALNALEVTAIAAGEQAVANLRIGPFNLIAKTGDSLPGGIDVRDVNQSGVTLERGTEQRRLEAP